MANMKIISMLDAKVQEAQSDTHGDLEAAINIIDDEMTKIVDEIQRVRQRVSKLEEGEYPHTSG